MLNFILMIYRSIFARKCFYRFNKLLYSLSLSGMGVLNFQSDRDSGEKHFLETYIPLLSKGVVFDVGANVGSYSEKVRKLGPDMEIYAFEPHPVTFKKLVSNAERFGFKTFNVGAGSARASLNLYDYANNDGSSHASLYSDVIEKIHKGRAVEHKVGVISLDDFVAELGIERVNLLKIDTEGHEMEVLKGFMKFIQMGKIDLIHFEFNEMNVASRVFFKDFLELLPDYAFYRMLPDGLVQLERYSPVFFEIFAYQNIVAIQKNSVVLN